MSDNQDRPRSRLASCARALNMAAFIILFVFVGIALIH
jgi:hypothetical protein